MAISDNEVGADNVLPARGFEPWNSADTGGNVLPI